MYADKPMQGKRAVNLSITHKFQTSKIQKNFEKLICNRFNLLLI